MPRKARKQSRTDCYHVMLRGINREYIFKSTGSKKKFLNLLGQEDAELIQIYAWCIMDNHIHLIIKAALEDLSRAIKVICLKYAAYYNKRNKRIGPLFGDRYKSENIEDDTYMLQVIRYIHMNPVKAKLVKKIEDYPWSSYCDFINEKSQDRKVLYILGFFNQSAKSFVEYHKKEDVEEFLEIKEDLEKYKIEHGQDIINEYFKNKRIEKGEKWIENPIWISEIVEALLTKTKLTLRQINQLTGISVGKILSIKNKHCSF